MADLNWTLEMLFDGVAPVKGALRPLSVLGIAVDSRCVSPGDLFFALAGTTEHGAHYIDQALARGAIAVVVEEGHSTAELQLPVEQIHQVLGQVSSRFYGEPSAQLNIAAVTGTDGKSTVAWLIASALELLESKSALLGTVENRMVGGGKLGDATHTTPPPVELQQLLSEVVQRGGRSVAMEASSHGIEQQRLAGTAIRSAILTQLGRDHIDYHGSEEAYREAKRKLFYREQLESIIINLDDALGQELHQSPAEGVEVVGYSLQQRDADLYGELVGQDGSGLQLLIHYRGAEQRLHSPLFGRFNASNLLAAAGLLLSWGHALSEVVEAVAQVQPLSGRMESFHGADRYGLPIVDYAHTPGALDAALQAVRQHLNTVEGSVWVVFGCGGERDRGKRPQMGAVAERWADHVVVTSDNPRSEAPMEIIEEILQGMQTPEEAMVVENREAAIVASYRSSRSGDVVLIAGKGHEEYQQIGTEQVPFSDRKMVAQLVAEVAHG